MWFTALLGLVDPISKIAGKIADARIAATNATTDREKIAADERVKGLEARMTVMVAEGGSRINAFTRAALAFPVAILLWKVFVWDKSLGQWTGGRTDALSPELWHVVMVVVGFYFVTDMVSRWRR